MDEDNSRKPSCTVCGDRIRRDNIFGVCQRTTDCRRARAEMRATTKTTVGLPRVLAGATFGRWTVLEDHIKGAVRVPCRCKCGTERSVCADSLLRGHSRSCGCGRRGAPLGRQRRSAENPYLHAGEVHGRLTVLQDAIRATDAVLCRCECGTEIMRTAGPLKNRGARSCGCYRLRHGLSRHPLYGIWRGILTRTGKPTDKSYPAYGGRGIRMCERWQGLPAGLLNFATDVGERPPGTSLDRIDNDGHYEPGNVRWATAKTQGNNKRTVASLTRELEALKARMQAATSPPAAKGARRPVARGQMEPLF